MALNIVWKLPLTQHHSLKHWLNSFQLIEIPLNDSLQVLDVSFSFFSSLKKNQQNNNNKKQKIGFYFSRPVPDFFHLTH